MYQYHQNTIQLYQLDNKDLHLTICQLKYFSCSICFSAGTGTINFHASAIVYFFRNITHSF